ncbi:hypothetical protein KPP2020_055 [Klebsiella phage KPP2020]|uniref:Uncharacterized protein n=1 Tax=Klebsiella phage KPP2020 TaxID=3017288 RepID=A0AAF0BWD1_9CAUD|nr:hypothetical protein KPP2020_055 [Klebsiella phage KPP2020]
MLASSVAQEADCSRNVAVLLRPAKPLAQVVIRVAFIRQAVARAHLECEDVAVTVDGNVGGPALDGGLRGCGRGAFVDSRQEFCKLKHGHALILRLHLDQLHHIVADHLEEGFCRHVGLTGDVYAILAHHHCAIFQPVDQAIKCVDIFARFHCVSP